MKFSNIWNGIFIAIFLALISCSSNCDYEQIANQITSKTAKKIEIQTGLRLIGTGGGMMNDIKMLAMSFQYFHTVDLAEARKLLVVSINEYLSAINSDIKIKPYLNIYPFPPQNIQIHIWIYQPDHAHPPLDKLFYISAIDGMLTYYLDLPKQYSRQKIFQETYEEALKLVDNQEFINK